MVAVTDYMRELPDMIRSWVSVPWRSLGTDGFGRSDTRDELRRFFETDQSSIEIAALATLAQDNKIDAKVVQSAIERHGIDPELPPPWMR